ncbi:MAG TPA: hypothetical protein VIM48_04730 [Chthoniobacterales bacterium]
MKGPTISYRVNAHELLILIGHATGRQVAAPTRLNFRVSGFEHGWATARRRIRRKVKEKPGPENGKIDGDGLPERSYCWPGLLMTHRL